MQIEKAESKLLIDELQLGIKLNECVHAQRRHDFSLMLSMLVADVCVHSQFSLPLTESEQSTMTEDSLRRTFNVAPKAPLALNSLDDIKQFQQGKLVEDSQLATIRLADALHPKPLAFRDDKAHIPSEVMKNTSLYCQQKKQIGTKERRSFNVDAWLNSVQETVVKAPLMDLVA
ncbi:VC2046/SO_2500 family protein [Thalassotalea piscium]